MYYSVRGYTEVTKAPMYRTYTGAVAVAVIESDRPKRPAITVIEVWDGTTNIGIRAMYYRGQRVYYSEETSDYVW